MKWNKGEGFSVFYIQPSIDVFWYYWYYLQSRLVDYQVEDDKHELTLRFEWLPFVGPLCSDQELTLETFITMAYLPQSIHKRNTKVF